MSELIRIITSTDAEVRNRSLDAFSRAASLEELLAECDALDRLRRTSENFYERVRALFFLYAIYRFHLPAKTGAAPGGRIPFAGHEALLRRRFEEAVEAFLEAQRAQGPCVALFSALAGAYHRLGFQTLAGQVRRSVRSVAGNQWMFRVGHPADHPLRIRKELLHRPSPDALFPVLRETTPVRMDLTHSGWSDIFFLGMDFPEGARVLNVSIDLAVHGAAGGPKPPVEAWLRIIDQPILRLASVDLGASAEITTIAEVFDFARDYLGLLKAAVIASGIVPSGMEGASQPLSELLERLTGVSGHGLEIVSRVNDIPKGSRLAVSTNLLGCLISAMMRATSQTRELTGPLGESDRRLVAARAILGEWLGGSGGGWQDSGGLWPSLKLIYGVKAVEGDAEFGVSRGCLLPRHHVFGPGEVTPEARRALEQSLVLVHGGMAQDVGPILEMVTEKYLLRSEAEWQGRQDAMRVLDEVTACLKAGDVRGIGAATQRNFDGPIQTIVPWVNNLYTQTLIERVRAEFGADFWGFWMLGGMSGGGMGFIFHPSKRALAVERLQVIMSETKRALENAVPFAMEPVVYDFAVNERGSWAELRVAGDALMPSGYYTQTLPALLRTEPRLLSSFRRAEMARFGEACRRQPELAGMVETLFDRLIPRTAGESGVRAGSLDGLLEEYGFDRIEHEQIRADMRSGRIGLAQNRLAASSQIHDVEKGDVVDATGALDGKYRNLGERALAEGAVAVVSLAGGAGSRWTKGAGVVKALNPFAKLGGRHRSFLEVHLAKSRLAARLSGCAVPHIITTSYLTHEAIEGYLAANANYGYTAPLLLSAGRGIGLRLVPMVRDLRFAWEETAQQLLDERAQKVRESLHTSLIGWAERAGEGSDYTDNLPMQCLHPVGHWYEVPNLLRNGVLKELLRVSPRLRHLMVHNVDTLGVDLDAGILGLHIDSGAALTTEVIHRVSDDRGGGLARVNGRVRLVEGLALPDESIEFGLSFYNSSTTWVDIDQFLAVFGLTRDDLDDGAKVATAVRALAARMPTYITLKDVKKRWGKGQEDIFPVAQFEKLWGDMTALAGVNCRFVVVPRARGQQLKEPAQLDGWLRDGSAAYVESLCEWPG
jgi:hypothetical protein